MVKRFLLLVVVVSALLAYTLVLPPTQRVEPPYSPAMGKVALAIEPEVRRVIEVRRENGSVDRYVKDGDPIVLQWYSLVANTVLGLQYTANRLQVINVDGTVSYGIDTGFGGCGTQIQIYISSDESSAPDFTTHSLPRDAVRFDTARSTDITGGTAYGASLSGEYTNKGAPTIIRQIFVTLRYCSDGRAREVMFIADSVDPPVYVGSEEMVYVEWIVSFPKPCPFLDGFWTAIRPLFGLTSSVDFGVDSSNGDTVSEILLFSIGSKSIPFTESWYTISESGLAVTFKGSYTVERMTTLTEIRVLLKTDTDTSDKVRTQTLQIFIGEGNIVLNEGDVITVVLQVLFKNLFS
ncbi:MAG: hypothetical protein QXQ90_05350 [Desulfurococcaceae archaeon]